MSAKGKGRNSKNSSITETPSPAAKKSASSSTTPSSIIRTRHQAVQEANPDKEIRRKPTPGIELLKKSKDDFSPKAKARQGKSSGVEDSEDDATPKRRKPAKKVAQFKPLNVNQKQTTPKSTPKSASKVNSTPKSAGASKSEGASDVDSPAEPVKRGRGRPPKVKIIDDTSTTGNEDSEKANKKGKTEPKKVENKDSKEAVVESNQENGTLVEESKEEVASDIKDISEPITKKRGSLRGSQDQDKESSDNAIKPEADEKVENDSNDKDENKDGKDSDKLKEYPLRRKSLDGDHLKEASKASKRPSESIPETGDSKRKKTSNTDEDKPSTPVVPERRGRGRPKKQQLQSPIANLNKSQNATTEEVTSTTVASVSAPNKKPDFSKLAASFSPEKVKAWAHKVKIPIPDSTSFQRPSRTGSPRTQEARESINELFARKLAEAKGLVDSPETKVPSTQKKNTPASKTKPATETDKQSVQESKKKPGSDSAKKPDSASGATKNSNNATTSVNKPVEDTESTKTGKGTIKKINVPTDLLKKVQAPESKSNSIGIEKVTPNVEEADVPQAASDDKPIADADTPKKDADNSSESKLLETSASSKKSSTPSNQKAVSKTKKAVKGTKKTPKATPKSSKTPASEDQTSPKTTKKPMTPDDLFDVSDDDDETDSAKDSNSDAGSPPDSPRSTDRVLESPSKKLGLNNKSPNSKAKKFTWDDDVVMQSEDESTSLLDPYTGEYSGKLQTPSPKKEASTMMLDILASACLSQSHPQPSNSIQASSTLTTTISTSVGPSAIKGALKATPVLTPSVTSTDFTATSVTAPIQDQDQPTNSIDPTAATEMESTPANLKSSKEETGASLTASEDLPEPMETDQETDQISSLSQNQNSQATTSTVKVVKFASHKSESGEDDPLRKFYTVTTVPLDTVASKKPTPKKKGATQGELPLPSVPVPETTSQEKSYSQIRSPEDAVLISPEAAHSKQSVPTSAVSTDTTQHKVDVISVVNASLEKEDENTWILDKLINLFIQWQNTDAMCWLDVVLAILAHSPTLQEKAKTWASNHKSDPQIDSLADSLKPEAADDVANCVESMLNKLCDESTSVEDILKTPEKKAASDTKSETASCQSTPMKDDISKKSKLKFPVIITLIKAHEQAQYLLQNFLRKPDDNKITDSIHKEGDLVCQTSSNPQTGAGIKIISPLLTMLHKQPEGGLPLDALTHLGESIAKLEDVREVVWDILQPRLKCEKGKNDSPVFALPLLIRESAELKHMFSIEYSLVFHCAKCDYRQENKFQKALPSLPNVPADFSMKDPAFIRNCFRCEAPGQKMEMKIHRMQDIAMLHFLQGLPKVVYDELDFEFEGSLYSVTAVVQYKNNPDHFVSWLRNPQGNQWMECDDLKSPLCQFENAPPRIPPEQIHIVMWEKNIALTPARALENSKTAGLLSSLLMSTRMVTMSSEGNSKVLTTVPIQYTPVSTAVGKRKGDMIAVSTPQGGNKIVMYPALNTRPNIISHTKGATATQSAATTAEASTDPSAQAKPGESIQTIGGDKTKVVIVGPKNNQIPPSSGSSSEIRTVSIGGRIVRLTIEQLNAIRNSPGARVSIVGAEGTTTFSIKGLQNKKPDAVTPKQSVIKTPSKVVTQTSTTSLMSTTASPTVTTISSGLETPSASSLITSSAAHIQSDSPSTTVIQSTDSGQTIAKTTTADQVLTLSNQQSASSQTSIGTQLQNAALTPSQPRIIISKGPAPPATTDLGLGLDNFVDPKKPCRVVVDSKGQVTAIANKDGTKFIPLTNDKTKNRQILQDFFCKDQASTSSSSAATVSVSLPGGNLTSLLGPTQPITVSAPGSSTVGRTLQIVTQQRPGESPSVRSLLQPTPKPIPQAYSSVFTVNKQNDVSNFETAMAVDSISSPQSRQTYPSYNTSQYIAPARGRGSRGGRKTTAPRGRGRGMTTTIMPMPTPGTTQAVPSPSSTATTGKLQITPSQSSLSGQKVSSTNRKVAIPTNNGHILITVPAGRTVMECLRDPSIVKTLVKKFPGSATEGVPAVSEPLTISTSVSSPAAPSQTSPLPPRVPTNINRPSSIYSSELFKHMQSSTTQSNIKAISVPKAQESRIHQILQNSTSLLPKKAAHSSPSTSKTDVLSAALFESGVQEDTSSFVGKSSQSVIVQGVPQTDLYTTHGLDILSQGVVAASQTQDELQHAATISQDSSQSTAEQAKSQAFDILTQGLLGVNDAQDSTNTQSMESQAMNILTGGITPQAPPAPSQGLDILTQGLNPPPVASSHSLDILTQGISPNLQQQLNKTPVIAKKEIPKASTLLTGGMSIESRPTPSMKIGNIGATSGRKSMIMSPTKSRFKTSPPKPATIYTIKSNGSRSTEVVESTPTQPDTYSMLNPSTKAALKRKASGTTEYTSLLKKAKPDMPGHIISSSSQNVTTVFSGETAGSWKFIGPNSGETASLPVPVPIENEAATNEYLTQPAADVSASSSTEDSIFSKFGMTTSDGVDPREAEVLRQLYDAVSQAGQTSTEATTSTTDAALGQAGDTSTSTTMSLDTNASTTSLLTGTSDSLVTTDTDGRQQTLGTDGTEQQIMASDPNEQKIVMGIDENGQQVVMGTETGQEDTTATDESQQIVMGIDEHGQQVVSINGQQFVVGVDENGQQVLVGADETGQQIIMTMDGQILGTDGTTQIVTETASADQAGQIMGVDENGMTTMTADQILATTGSDQIFVGPNGEIISPDQLVIAPDGTITCPALEEMANSGNTTYLASSDNPVPTTSEQQVVIEEEVTTVAENVEI